MPAQPYRVIAVEFARETTPRSFAPLLPPAVRDGCLRIDPLDHPDIGKAVRTIGEQADHWALQADTGGQPAVVLGYCSGSGLASELAARLGPDTVLVLADPVFPTPAETQGLLAEMATGMDEDLDPADVPGILGRDPDDTLAVVRTFLRSLVERCAPDLPEDIFETLTAHQRAWMSYTLAAGAHGRTLPRRPDHVLLSAAAEWDGAAPGRAHRFPADAVGLFSHAGAAAVLAGVLAP
ncbi:hypothetical protein [Streptomyces sp. NPDC018045]|uniref:hypothetical protein n=1 Tax=Streptomyces sp. NPDC018045 TaxID=3365037 RepID=UPI0037A554E5